MNKLIILTLSFFTFTLYAQTITDLETEKTNLKNRLSSIENERNNSFKDYQSILSIENEQLELLNLSISNIVSSKDSLMVLISKYKVSESNLKSFNILKNEEIVDSKSPKYGSIYKKLIKEFSLLNDQNLIVTPNKTFIIQFDLAGRIDSIISRIPSAKTIAKQDDLIKKGKLTLLTSETKSAFIYLLTGVNKDYLLKLDELKIVTDSLELLNSKKVKQENKLKDLTKERDLKISNLDFESEKIRESLAKIEKEIKKINNDILVSDDLSTVQIGTQIWTTKNLNVIKFRNGDPIPEAKTVAEWVSASEKKQPAWCNLENINSNGGKFGKIYNWYAINDPRGICPEGYHIPSQKEWEILKTFVINDPEKLKSTESWNSFKKKPSVKCDNCSTWNKEYRKKVPCHKCKDTRRVEGDEVVISGNGNNLSGFNGIAGGQRTSEGKFIQAGTQTGWWSSTSCDNSTADCFSLLNNTILIWHICVFKGAGGYVRCVKD